MKSKRGSLRCVHGGNCNRIISVMISVLNHYGQNYQSAKMEKWCRCPFLILVDHLDPPLVAENELEADLVVVNAVPDGSAPRDPDV